MKKTLIKKYFQRIILGVCCLSIVGGCSSPTPTIPPEAQIFLHPHPFSEYQSSGRILLKNNDENHSGDLGLDISTRSELRIQIFAPVIGSLLYELRASSDKFMMLDFQHQQFFLDENHRRNRVSWLGTDLTLEELSWIVWGRVPKQFFEVQGGRFLEPNHLVLSQPPISFEIFLNKLGLMDSMVKTEGSLPIYKVQIVSYQNFDNKLLPKMVKIDNLVNQNKLVFVFTSVSTPSTLPALDFVSPSEMKPLIEP